MASAPEKSNTLATQATPIQNIHIIKQPLGTPYIALGIPDMTLGGIPNMTLGIPDMTILQF
jgi:hypothetical protein